MEASGPDARQEDSFSLLGEEISSPYMLRAISVSQEAQERIPATVHIDGTARLQTVTRASEPLLHELLSAFSSSSGTPAVLNTSFNDEAEPIVCSPQDALKTFFSTGIDTLFMNNFVIGSKNIRRNQ